MGGAAQNRSIWSGVYERFDDVPVGGPVFDSAVWADKQKVKIKAALETFKAAGFIPGSAQSRDYPFSSMLALLLAERSSLRVIDYGGAMGHSYLEMLAQIPEAQARVDYTIVETPATIAAVPDEMKVFENLHFVDDVEAVDGEADVVHLGSTLQYIDDWKSFLSGLSQKFQPQLFVLSDLLVGDVPSFVTAQQYYDHTISVRFINAQEFQEFWAETPYELIYSTHFQPIEGDDYFPNHALPETHRLKKACHMVLSKKRGQ